MFASTAECRRVTGLGAADCGAEPDANAAPAVGMTLRNMVLQNVRVINVSTMRQCPGFGGGCNCVPPSTGGPLPMGIPSVITGGPGPSNNISGLHFINVTVAGMGMREALASPAFNLSTDFVTGITIDGKPL
jgi:hypothetical protein